ncbi:MAG TPA: YcaO-like family protein [Candidatus Paceibacterota bacterium]|nr:YcaO-like family protein [Candidatus Paceibacterota bacterium]
MFRDVDAYDELFSDPALKTFVHFLERRTNATMVVDSKQVPFGKKSLIDASRIATLMTRAGVIDGYAPFVAREDEPRTYSWVASYVHNTHSGKRKVGSGMSIENDKDALYAALAESLERHVWMNAFDYYDSPLTASASEMSQYDCIPPDKFVGLTHEQRGQFDAINISPGDKRLWLRAHSWINHKSCYIPAEMTSPAFRKHPLSVNLAQSIIRPAISTGLATYPTRIGALLRGALEVIERDAYMVMWLNQLTLPQIKINELRRDNLHLDTFLCSCERYQFKPHAIQLISDAPTNIVCVILEDMRTDMPRFTIGLKAHPSLTCAFIGGLLEALRAREQVRRQPKDNIIEIQQKPISSIKSGERIAYWADKERSRKLEFMLRGNMREPTYGPWERDSEEEHWGRIVAWAKAKRYELLSVSLTKSSYNPTRWHIENVLIPQMQPMHQLEQYPFLGGDRLAAIPSQAGYTARETPFADAPHPFA